MAKIDVLENAPNQNSTAEEWKAWHEALKSHLGLKKANFYFVKVWSRIGSNKANTVELREYLRKNGIEISRDAFNRITDLGADAVDFYGSLFKAGRTAAFALGGIAIIGIGMIVYNLAKNPVDSAGAIANARTGGALKKLR